MDYNDNNENIDYQQDSQQSFYDEESIAARRRERAARRRKQLIIYRAGLVAVLAVIVLIIVLIAKGCSKDNTSDVGSGTISGDVVLPTPDPNDTSVGQSDEEEEELPVTATFTLSAVGDIMVYDDQMKDAYDSVSGSYDFTHCFTQVSGYLSAADLTVGTLETTLAGADVGYQGKPDFNAPTALASNLKNSGFNILSTACTYSLQHGISGLISTIKNVREAGMDSIGTYYTQEDRSSSGGVLVKEINGVKVGFLAYTKGCNGISIPEGYEYSVNMLYTDYATYFSDLNKTQILSDLEAAKALDLDVLVAVLHWGQEYETSPSDSQKEIADLLFENGVDVILGSHPHYLQPVETKTVTTVDGEEKEVLVAYSLGNFISSMNKDYSNDSIILNMTITVDKTTGKLSFDKVNYVPVYISGETNRFVIYDINQSIVDFNSGSSSISDDLYVSLRDSLEHIHQLVGSDMDVGNQTSYEPTPIISSEPTPEEPDTGATEPDPATSTEVPETSDAPAA